MLASRKLINKIPVLKSRHSKRGISTHLRGTCFRRSMGETRTASGTSVGGRLKSASGGRFETSHLVSCLVKRVGVVLARRCFSAELEWWWIVVRLIGESEERANRNQTQNAVTALCTLVPRPLGPLDSTESKQPTETITIVWWILSGNTIQITSSELSRTSDRSSPTILLCVAIGLREQSKRPHRSVRWQGFR
jgi:hypothetical protein